MTPENAASAARTAGRIDSLNAELLAEYAGQLERLPLTGHSPRTNLGAVGNAYPLAVAPGLARPAGHMSRAAMAATAA